MAEERDILTDAPATPVAQRRSCLASLAGSLLSITLGALLGAALAILFFWYGPANLGFRMPDSTGRIQALEDQQATAVIERTEIKTTLNNVSDVRGSLEQLRTQVQTLQSTVDSRDVNLDDLRAQLKANFDSLLALQRRIDELESIPANAALANRLATAELELATIGQMLERMRTALAAPLAAPAATPTPASTAVPGR